MVAKLTVASGKNAGKAIALKRSKLLIGRADECDIRPLSDEVSRRHCAVVVEPEGVFVEDLRSRNGTFVNGNRIEGRVALADGDMVRIGSLELKFSGSRPEQSRATGDDDISRWLMADDEPAGMFDTTQAMRIADEATRPVVDISGSNAGVSSGSGAPSAGSGAGAPSMSGHSDEGHDATGKNAHHPGEAPPKQGHEAAESAERTPAGFMPKQTKKSSENSRDAAADALRKFFGTR